MSGDEDFIKIILLLIDGRFGKRFTKNIESNFPESISPGIFLCELHLFKMIIFLNYKILEQNIRADCATCLSLSAQPS